MPGQFFRLHPYHSRGRTPGPDLCGPRGREPARQPHFGQAEPRKLSKRHDRGRSFLCARRSHRDQGRQRADDHLDPHGIHIRLAGWSGAMASPCQPLREDRRPSRPAPQDPTALGACLRHIAGAGLGRRRDRAVDLGLRGPWAGRQWRWATASLRPARRPLPLPDRRRRPATCRVGSCGGWLKVIDHPDRPDHSPESSATAMFASALNGAAGAGDTAVRVLVFLQGRLRMMDRPKGSFRVASAG